MNNKKDLELQRVYDSYLKAQGDLYNALDERIAKLPDNSLSNEYGLWDFLTNLQRQVDDHKIYGMEKLINREQGVHHWGKLQKIDYSPLD